MKLVDDALWEEFEKYKVGEDEYDLSNATVEEVMRAYTLLENSLDEKEISVFKRGRNFHTSNTPKNSTGREYHIATGLECLFGYLYLSGQKDRVEELFKIVWESFKLEEN